MSVHPTPPVVLAVGYEHVEAALALAAAEATRLGTGLHLVHAVRSVAQGPELMLVVKTDLVNAGRRLLEDTRERALDLVGPGTAVTTELGEGRIVPTLVELSADARCIVLEHRILSGAQRLTTRSVASGVAARARIPVLTVPANWSSATAGTTSVVVGVDEPEESREVLRVAATEARDRGASLTVLHAWGLEERYGSFTSTPEQDELWMAQATADIQRELDGLAELLSGVSVKIEMTLSRPAEALVEASQVNDLVVLGRHNPRLPFGSHLGPVVRAVLNEAASPILLVDSRPAHA